MVSDDVWVELWIIEHFLTQAEYGKKYAWLYKDFFHAFADAIDLLFEENLIISETMKPDEKSDEIKMTFKEVWMYYWSKYNDRNN